MVVRVRQRESLEMRMEDVCVECRPELMVK